MGTPRPLRMPAEQRQPGKAGGGDVHVAGAPRPPRAAGGDPHPPRRGGRGGRERPRRSSPRSPPLLNRDVCAVICARKAETESERTGTGRRLMQVCTCGGALPHGALIHLRQRRAVRRPLPPAPRSHRHPPPKTLQPRPPSSHRWCTLPPSACRNTPQQKHATTLPDRGGRRAGHPTAPAPPLCSPPTPHAATLPRSAWTRLLWGGGGGAGPAR